VVGGIIPKEDEQALLDMGVTRIYTPKDYQMYGYYGGYCRCGWPPS